MLRTKLTKLIRAFVFLATGALLFSDTVNLTWDDTDWNVTWTGAGSGCDTTNTYDYQVTGGNPDHRRRSLCNGKNDVGTGHHDWTGTWETLGVTPGNVVSTIQMTDVDRQYTTDTNCDSVVVGPLELRTSADALISTLWTGSGALTTAGAYAAAGSQSAQSVGALQASSSNIELWMHSTLDIANVSAAICEASFDNLDITIVHAIGRNNRVITSWLLPPRFPGPQYTRVSFSGRRLRKLELQTTGEIH